MQRINQEKQLIEEIKECIPDAYQELIDSATIFAKEIHKNDFRDSGENFLIHTLNVALNCCEIGLDTNSVLAAILHQTITLGDKTKEEIDGILKDIESMFGEDVKCLVSSVEEINQATKLDKQTDFKVLQKYFIGGVNDLRPTLIKICDILDNIRTIKYVPEEKQKKFSKKIFNIYGPLCEYTNLPKIKREIENVAFEIASPINYNSIKEKLKNENINEDTLNKYKEYLETIIGILGFKTKIFGRIKGEYSIFNKLRKYEDELNLKGLGNVNDIYAFTVLTDSKEKCYEVSHAIQDLSNDLPEFFDDYIQLPKPNGYSGIHITTRIPEISNQPIEIQIMTDEMYEVNTYGPASHIAYKAALKRIAPEAKDIEWIKDVHESIDSTKEKAKLKRSIPINAEIFNNIIFVQTPLGKLIELPKYSTPIDFAYKIHQEIGNSAISAKVNNIAVKLSHTLNTGDIVEIICQKGKTMPDPKWFSFVASNSTRQRIMRTLASKTKLK
ncbi:HD domain-containing protein [Candidatus Dojkabacteria bacterium]|jgi:GTP pyrophosphokinase|nr:HD domain-containing protein [Candidatus Dojkabacteria bacterium]